MRKQEETAGGLWHSNSATINRKACCSSCDSKQQHAPLIITYTQKNQ